MNSGWGPTLRFGRPAEVKTLAEATLFRIRRDIISGTLAPGSKIKSDHLRERYDVGISPLREALFQLVSEGLVRADGQRGFRVSGTSRDDLIDVTNWRMKLECEAIELAILHGDKAWEERCVSALRRLTDTETDPRLTEPERANQWETVHREFHFSIYEACGSAWLLRFCELLSAQSERYRRLYVKYDKIDSVIVNEHSELLEAVLQRQGEKASALLRHHIQRASQLAAAQFSQA